MDSHPYEEALFVDRAAADPDAPVTPFVAMQRVVVRMLFDPAFVERVYDDPERALAGIELDPPLVKQLLQNDRRLWNADRLRRSRALKILIDEFKVSTTLVLWEFRQVAFLDAFFASESFHTAVERRGYMALAFVSYIEAALAAGEFKSAQLRAALDLESTMARSRRELRDARRGRDAALRPIRDAADAAVAAGKTEERWVTQPGVRAAWLAGGTIGLVHHIEKYLFEISQVPALALCDDVPRPDPLPELDAAERQAFLFEPEPRGKVELSEIPPSFAHVISACGRPVTLPAIAATVAGQGIAAADVRDLVEQLYDAGVLRRVQVDEAGRVSATD